jgi:glycosyltransferase involved in cell wall biosynthesis
MGDVGSDVLFDVIGSLSMPANGFRRPEGRTVLFVTNTPGYGGTEKHLLELLRRLGNCGVRSLILCAGTDPYSDRLNGRNHGKVSIRCEKALKSIWDWFRVFRDIRPDVVVFVYGTLTQHPWYASVAGRFAGIRRLYAIQQLIPPPVPPKVEVRSIHDLLERLIGKRTRWVLRSTVQSYLCDKTICVSNAVRESLVRDYRFPRRKTVTVHNSVSVSEFAPSGNAGAAIRTKLELGSEEFVLVCAARLSEEKGIDILLLAMSQLLHRNLQCKCIIVGDGDLREKLLEQVRALGLTHHVFMVGFQEDVRPYLLAGNAFVLTSHKEGLPFAVLEAMACGLPCVVTNVGGNVEAVAHNVNGFVVSAGSVDEVAEAISSLLADPHECARMSRVARSIACEQFDIEPKMADTKKIILA